MIQCPLTRCEVPARGEGGSSVETFIVIWAIFGVAAGVVGSNRGGDGCAWFAVGFLLGPIGFALAFSAGVKCPNCRMRIPEGAKQCAHCQTKLEKPEPNGGERHVGRAVPHDQPTKPCPFCAETILAAALKCKHCGEFLPTPCRACGHALDPTLNPTRCNECGALIAAAPELPLAVEVPPSTGVPSLPGSPGPSPTVPKPPAGHRLLHVFFTLNEQNANGVPKPPAGHRLLHDRRHARGNWAIGILGTVALSACLAGLTIYFANRRSDFTYPGGSVYPHRESFAKRTGMFHLAEEDRLEKLQSEVIDGRKAVLVVFVDGPHKGDTGFVACDDCPFW